MRYLLAFMVFPKETARVASSYIRAGGFKNRKGSSSMQKRRNELNHAAAVGAGFLAMMMACATDNPNSHRPEYRVDEWLYNRAGS